MRVSCDTCRYRYRGLDPYGCSKQVRTTGVWDRLWVLLFGCERWELMDGWSI